MYKNYVLILTFAFFKIFTLGAQEITSADSLYPIKVFAGDKELTCFEREQAQKIFAEWQTLQSCNKAIKGKDSLITSLKTEISLFDESEKFNSGIISSQYNKLVLMEGIIQEKNKQLTLAKREGIVSSLSNKRSVWNAIGLSAIGGLAIGLLIKK